MQLCGTIYCPLIALHVSSDIIAHHHQEVINCIFTASGGTYVTACRYRGRIRTDSDSPTTPAGSDVRMYHQKL